MGKVVETLITKWVYKVDAAQIREAAARIRGLKKAMAEVKKSSVDFGVKERKRITGIRESWRKLNTEVKGYRRNVNSVGMFSGAGRGRGGAGRGGGGGRGGVSPKNSLAFLAGRLTGSTALTSALLGGAGITAALGVGKMIQQAGKREGAETTFTGLLGSGEKANQLLDDLNAFGKRTPFRIGELRELSQEILGGDFSQNDIIPLLQKLGDVTQGNAPKLRRMITNMVEIKNIGRANTRDIRQFGRAGIPIFKELTKVLGKSGTELDKMITGGKIGFKEVQKALIALTSEGGKFYRGMERRSQTLFGQLSNLGDALEIMAEKAGAPFLKPLTNGVKNAIVWLGKITEPLRSVFVGLSFLVGGMYDFVMGNKEAKSAVTNLGLTLSGLAILFVPLARILTIIFLLLEDIGVYAEDGNSGIGLAIEGIKKLKKELKGMVTTEINTPGVFSKGVFELIFGAVSLVNPDMLEGKGNTTNNTNTTNSHNTTNNYDMTRGKHDDVLQGREPQSLMDHSIDFLNFITNPLWGG